MKRNRHSADDAAFRAIIWQRDQGRDRCTGRPLSKDAWDIANRGDVAHIRPKSTYPELRHDSGNACLISRELHILSDGRGGYLLKIEGDADETLTFRRYDRDGQLLWVKESPCPK